MLLESLQKYRRDLHQIPETGLDVMQTCMYIKRILEPLPCELSSPIPNSLCAFFDNGKSETIAFRSDMDALPIKERNTHTFVSQFEGKMHACGHDGHMAMLLAFASELSSYYTSLPHNVFLIFQPGEETPGGADAMIQTGMLKKYHVKKIFGCHLWPNLSKGVIATRKGEFMARASEIDITIKGKSVHIAKYQKGNDAMEAGCAFVTKMYAMEKNEIAKDVARLLRFGTFMSGTTRNIVANGAYIGGSLRAFQDDVYDYMYRRISEIRKEIEQQYHVTIEMRIAKGYPALINDHSLCDHILTQLKDMHIQLLSEPEMIAEDFAFYQKEVPGVFFFLGTGNYIPLHADIFDFDESVLLDGVALYRRLSMI